MSLSRPVRFPLLKLPWLCIEGVVRSCDIFEIIFFALTSKKTHRIVKSFKIPLDENLSCTPIPLYTSITNDSLTSYTFGNGVTVLKLAIEFLNEVFKCSIKEVAIEEDYFPLSGNISVKSTENLCINQINTQPFGYAPNKKLKLLLENLEVTGTCTFGPNSTEIDFYCDPKIFKCRKLVFRRGSAACVTPEILMQFEVPQLKFDDCPFSVQDILSFVTNWLHSDNKKLEYLCIVFRRQISLDEFQTSKMELLPFSKRARIPISESFCGFFIHFSKGLEIVRHDGLSASMHVKGKVFLFYIWHDQ